MREMKDSRIEWIGAIPADWEIIRTKNKFRSHKDIAGSAAESYERLALTLNGVIKRSKEDSTGLQPEAFNGYQILRAGELVFKLIDLENISTSRVGLSAFTGIVSPAYIVLTPSNGINSSYAQYFFLSMWQREVFNHMGDDGVRSSLNAKDLLNIPLTYPSLAEQERIAAFLDRECSEIDALISRTRDSIAEYKKLKQAVITKTVTLGVKNSQSTRCSQYEWIGEYPAHWREIKIKWLLQERKDRSETGDEEPLSMSQKYGLIPTKDMDRVPNMAATFVGAKLVYRGDLVFNKLKAHLGVFAVSEYDGLVSPDYAVYYPSGVADMKFLEYLFKTPQYIAEFRKKSSGVGAGLTRLYTDDLYSIYCALPPMEEQLKIVEYLKEKCAAMDELIAQKEQFVTELQNYKKTLIYEYVTGKKEVLVEQSAPVITFLDARALLICRIVELMKPKGRIHLQKAMHMVDCLLGLNNETQYSRHKHGPYDVRIQEYEQAAEKKGWIKVKQGSSVEYSAGAKLEEYRDAYLSLYGDVDAEIQRICTFLAPMKTSQSERVATLLAAWNDFLLDGVNPTDQQLIQEVRTNWTPNKANSPEATWQDTLNKIRNNGFVPKGKGKHTITER